MKRHLLICLLVPAAALAEDAVDFQKDIAPLFRETCVQCHGAEKKKGDLRLDTRTEAMKGGKNGEVIKPGNAAESELYKRIILPKSDVDIMPAEGEPLTKAQTDLIKAWIDQGAKWPDDVSIEVAVSKPQPPAAGTPRPAATAPDPELPADFKPGPDEAPAIEEIAKAGVDVRPLAQNSPWREVNFRMQGEKITDNTVAPLKDIKSLVEVNFANTKVTDTGLSVLTNLPYLTTLHLELTGTTDAGLAHVSSLSNLVYLNLYGTRVTDAGLDHLKGLKHLKRLYVWQSQVTPEGARRLQESMPSLDVNTGWDVSSLTNAPAKSDEKEEAKKE